jgi:hypothetical protein
MEVPQKLKIGWAMWHVSVIPVLERPRKEDFEFEATQGHKASSSPACTV